jgi:dihydropteroate synthase
LNLIRHSIFVIRIFKMTALQFNQWLHAPQRRPLVMGILNVTPDSFSDGGQFSDVSAAVAHGQAMAAAGASIIDIGGESTRPGSAPVPPAEQVRRVVPIIRELRDKVPAILSVDTGRAEVAEAALDAGAALVNDVFAGRDDPDLFPLIARRRVPMVLMHMQGRPATMQLNPAYADVTLEVIDFLRTRLAAAMAAGIDASSILIDPGIGFGKCLMHNLELLRRMSELKSVGRPIVVGASRKSFIGKITGEDAASNRIFGTAASIAWAVANGANVLRVHDVGPTSQVVRMIEAIQTGAAHDLPPGS